MTPEVGAQIGDYRLLSRIGRGAYGVVFEAGHVITERVDALKVLLDANCSEDEERRFLREIRAHACLQHPNIATVYNAFRSPCGLVLVMERVPGQCLRSVVEQQGRLPIPEALGYILETLAALDYAEQQGVIHRDIKPENILITPEGKVKLTDFGLAHVVNRAQITGSGESLGTPAYMSPEQVEGLGKVDARTDVYSVGVVLYELLTGRLPFPGRNGFAVMRAHRETRPDPPVSIEPAIGRKLNAAVLKALEKDPKKRFQSSAAFRVALIEAAEPQPASPPVAFARTPVAAGIFVGFCFCAAALWTGFSTVRRHRAAVPVDAPHAAPPPAAVQAPPPPAPMVVDEAPVKPPEPVVSVSEDKPANPTAPRRTSARKPARRSNSTPPATASHSEPSAAPAQLANAPAAPAPAAESVIDQLPVLKPEAVAPPQAMTSSPPPSAPGPKAATPKKRNVLVRTFRKIIGRKETPAAGAAIESSHPTPAAMPARPPSP